LSRKCSCTISRNQTKIKAKNVEKILRSDPGGNLKVPKNVGTPKVPKFEFEKYLTDIAQYGYG